MIKRCLTAAALTVALVVGPAVAVSAAPVPDPINTTQVRIEVTWLGPNVYFWGYEMKNAGALALMAGAGAVATGCAFIKPTTPGTVAAKIICGGISAPALLLVGKTVMDIIRSEPRAAHWCFRVGPINQVTSIMPKLVVASLAIVGVAHCR